MFPVILGIVGFIVLATGWSLLTKGIRQDTGVRIGEMNVEFEHSAEASPDVWMAGKKLGCLLLLIGIGLCVLTGYIVLG